MKKTILFSIAFSFVFFTHSIPLFAQLLPSLNVNQLIDNGTVTAAFEMCLIVILTHLQDVTLPITQCV